MGLGRVFDRPASWLLNLGEGVRFSSDPSLLGARMLFMVVTLTSIIVIVSLLTRPTDPQTLREFVMRARPFRWCWLRVIRTMEHPYIEFEDFPRTILSWGIGVVSVGTLLFGIGELLLGSARVGLCGIVVFAAGITWTVRRMRADFDRQNALSEIDPVINPESE